MGLKHTLAAFSATVVASAALIAPATAGALQKQASITPPAIGDEITNFQ
ncbi:hypothetical protein [Bifidobacterium sp. ESL0790]|nr:hypothetical protein [Bifidobacterium sp. ESL0790]WEV72799.1 hypothetical protein OZY47_02150 [Bifidobacterium sp. ESL0790]